VFIGFVEVGRDFDHLAIEVDDYLGVLELEFVDFRGGVTFFTEWGIYLIAALLKGVTGDRAPIGACWFLHL
jgi:hypothetical protein